MQQLWSGSDKPELALPYNPNKNPINQSRQPQLDMDDDWIIQFLNETQVGHISTRDGKQPFINPTSFCYSSENHEIYFHSNAYGRMRFNAEQHPEACFECFKSGRLLPSNLALEVSFQYKCVIAFGEIRVIEKMNEKRNVLNGLLQKYFGEMKSGKTIGPSPMMN